MDNKQVKAMAALEAAYNMLENYKPKERGELARRYAITITQLEQVIGYFRVFVLQEDYWPKADE